MTIIILTVFAYLILAAHLSTSAFSQISSIPDSNNNSTNSNSKTTNSNNKISSSEGANSSSLNKITNTTKPKSLASQTNTIKVTASISKKAVDKFGIKEIYPTKKGGREWYINMADPRNDSIFSTGFRAYPKSS